VTLQSVDHALSAIDLLRTRESLGVAELADELGIARSSAHRLLSTLLRRGFAEQEPSSTRYRLGPSLRVNAMIAQRARTPVIERALTRIAGRLNETVHLALLRGEAVEYVAGAVPGTSAMPSLVGRPLPAHVTSTGKVLLAWYGNAGLSRLLPSERLQVFTPFSVRTRTALRIEIAKTRERGYARDVGEWNTDVTAIAVPLPHISQPMALGVVLPRERLQLSPDAVLDAEREYFVELRAAARALTERIAE